MNNATVPKNMPRLCTLNAKIHSHIITGSPVVMARTAGRSKITACFDTDF